MSRARVVLRTTGGHRSYGSIPYGDRSEGAARCTNERRVVWAGVGVILPGLASLRAIWARGRSSRGADDGLRGGQTALHWPQTSRETGSATPKWRHPGTLTHTPQSSKPFLSWAPGSARAGHSLQEEPECSARKRSFSLYGRYPDQKGRSRPRYRSPRYRGGPSSRLRSITESETAASTIAARTRSAHTR
jgi:hypothetical protein